MVSMQYLRSSESMEKDQRWRWSMMRWKFMGTWTEKANPTDIYIYIYTYIWARTENVTVVIGWSQ